MDKSNIRKTLIGIGMIGLTVFSCYTVRLYQNRKMTEAIIAERYVSTGERYSEKSVEEKTGESEKGILSDNIVIWKDQEYRRNTYVKSILCMGVDRSGSMQEYKGFNEAGQADGIFLIAQDTVRNRLKILMIPRDTMTEIGILNEDMTYGESMIKQLTLAYANGDGREKSCENMVSAVEKLLDGFSMDYYLAADTSVIGMLNDAVGGVTVTVPTSGMEQKDSAFVMGETITLHGEQAEAFVRYRDITKDYSAIFRMNQQREYIAGFFRALKKVSKENSQIVPELFEMIEAYMITDMEKGFYLKMAMDAVTDGSLDAEDFYMLPGSGVTTEVYDEFYADRDGALEVILNLFYRKAS